MPSRLAPVLVLCAMILAAVCGSSLWSYRQGAKAIHDRIDAQMDQWAGDASGDTEEAVATTIEDMESLARQPVMVHILDNDPDHEIAALLDHGLKRFPFVTRIECVLVAGKLLAWSGPGHTKGAPAPLTSAEIEQFRAGKRGVITEAGTNVVITVPIKWKFDQEELLGLLRAMVSIDGFMVRNEIWWFGLATPAGRILAQRGAGLASEIALKGGESVVPGLGRVIRRHRRVSLPMGIEGPQWRMVVAEQRETLFRPFNLLRRAVVEGMTGAAMVIVGLVALFAWRQRGLVVRLAEKARGLEAATVQLTMEIAERIAAEDERKTIQAAQAALVATSRQAGMAEVASSILHNVGNVLNSVSVSAELVAERVRKFRVASLKNVATLIREHAQNLPEFFTRDPRGQELPEYLTKLAEHLAEPQQAILKEMESLQKHIEHIKEIVALQQSNARGSGVLEPLSMVELIEDAININSAGFTRHEVRLIREYSPVPYLLTDRHKVLQILVNLLSNAKYALEEASDDQRLSDDKRLIVRLASNGESGVKITVIDNGTGIAPENLTRIFQLGFTTKKEGHGFGLHSGALAARELGGALTAHSDGVGQGAVFSLDLPIQTNPKRL